MNKTEIIKKTIKALCWTIVIAGWALYALIIIIDLIDPPAHQPNPIENIQYLLSSEARVHWRINLFMLGMIVLYFSAWAYTQKDKWKDE